MRRSADCYHLVRRFVIFRPHLSSVLNRGLDRTIRGSVRTWDPYTTRTNTTAAAIGPESVVYTTCILAPWIMVCFHMAYPYVTKNTYYPAICTFAGTDDALIVRWDHGIVRSPYSSFPNYSGATLVNFGNFYPRYQNHNGLSVLVPSTGWDDVESGSSSQESAGEPAIDPRAPRFGQLITATVLTAGIGFQEPLFVLAIAAVLVVAVLSGWRLDLYTALWRYGVVPLLGTPAETEPAAPHRFAKLVGASLTTVATVLLFTAPVVSLPGLALLGYVVAGLVAILAAIGGVGGYCLGCRMYRQVSYVRRLDIV